MKITFLEIAQIELDDAIEYYNFELPCLGDAFLTEVLNALDRIGEFPEAWHPCSKRTRRCQTRRFPYVIIYQIREQKSSLWQSLIFTENRTIGSIGYEIAEPNATRCPDFYLPFVLATGELNIVQKNKISILA